jgi:hypothetical protein
MEFFYSLNPASGSAPCSGQGTTRSALSTTCIVPLEFRGSWSRPLGIPFFNAAHARKGELIRSHHGFASSRWTWWLLLRPSYQGTFRKASCVGSDEPKRARWLTGSPQPSKEVMYMRVFHVLWYLPRGSCNWHSDTPSWRPSPQPSSGPDPDLDAPSGLTAC